MSDQDALELLDQEWTDFNAKNCKQRKKEYKGLLNVANKMRFQNLSILRDSVKIEDFAMSTLEQNFQLLDMVEETMAKTLQYERILHKNGIKVPSLETSVSKSGERSVVDKAPVKLVE